ncbi:dehydrogenase/reductase SDR family member 4-like isoform X2 [Brevipalpus obovatus]|uniref:dehydrogenase/reductase SDR family member 4-like isoform X2 n=1 Tax=Brevipalpus obovatus TaxID=246614 RepID=UPI003D9DCC6D
MLKNLGKLTGKVAVITASTDGIGLEIARRLGQEGASIVISSRNEQNVEKAREELKKENLDVSGMVCHVSKEEDRKALVDYTSERAWDKIFEVNVKAPFLLTKLVVPHMEKRGGGSIIYVASIAGYQPLPGIGAYSVSKTSLLGLTKAVSMELAASKIRVNCVCPGIIKTKFSKALWENPAAMELTNQMIPMGRIGESTEIAPMVSFLSSDDASYITGESFVISGGYFSRL